MKATRGWTLAALLLSPLLLIALHWPALDHEFVWTDQGEIVYGILIQPRGRLLESFTQPMHPDLGSLAPGSAQPYYRPLQVVAATTIDAQFGRRPRSPLRIRWESRSPSGSRAFPALSRTNEE